MIGAYRSLRFRGLFPSVGTREGIFTETKQLNPETFRFFSDVDKQSGGSPVHKSFPIPVAQLAVHPQKWLHNKQQRFSVIRRIAGPAERLEK